MQGKSLTVSVRAGIPRLARIRYTYRLLKAPVYKKALFWFALWLLVVAVRRSGADVNLWLSAFLDVFIGLGLIQVACQALLQGTRLLSEKLGWDDYVGATWAEIVSTLPELVVVGFLVMIDPYLAFLMVIITLYNNAMVFSCYSFFLPKDVKGKFLMPRAITEVGTQILVAGGALGMVIGGTMLGIKATDPSVTGFSILDVIFVSCMLLGLFTLYMYRLTRYYSDQEGGPRQQEIPGLDAGLLERDEVVRRCSWWRIVPLFLVGMLGAMLGGASVHDFAKLATVELNIDPYVAAFILAAFGGMSEYVIVWNAHRAGDYGIALANAFGGMTQVLFLILPLTFLLAAGIMLLSGSALLDLSWLSFNTSSILLFIFLFPTFYTLTALLEKDHTFDHLDTGVMVAIVAILLYLLISYGNGFH